jgi:hypothetical protein
MLATLRRQVVTLSPRDSARDGSEKSLDGPEVNVA